MRALPFPVLQYHSILRAFHTQIRQSRIPSLMARGVFTLCLLGVWQGTLNAATLKGRVLDPSGRVVAGAQVILLNSLHVSQELRSDAHGEFAFRNLTAGRYQITANAPGFSAPVQVVSLAASGARKLKIELKVSAAPEQVVVSASLADTLSSQTGASVSIITRTELLNDGDQFVLQALRDLPGVSAIQTGRDGGVTGVNIRGGESDYNLVLIDGAPINEFGGGFDFAPLLAEGISRIEVDRGPESALYGTNAAAGVVNITTTQGDGPPHFSFMGEGGSYNTSQAGASGSGLTRGLGWAYNLSHLQTRGVVPNDQYTDQSAILSLSLAQNPMRQFFFHFYGNANNAGAPGPFGSDPDHLFTGIDRVARDKQNLFGYALTFAQQFTGRFRQVFDADLSTNDYYFISPFGDSYSNNLNGVLDTRSEVTVSNSDFLSAGVEYHREQIRNSYIANDNGTPFLLPRSSEGYFAENRWSPFERLFITTGVRWDNFQTGALEAAPNTAGRPFLPASTVSQLSPRLSAAYLLHNAGGSRMLGLTRLHSSFGTGIRMPSGFELAFTNNGSLRPERNISFDAGVEQRFFGQHAALDATYFLNRFENQIVVLGGSLTNLSTFTSANLGNSRAQGVETSLRVAPTQSLQATLNYTLTASRLLALDGTSVALQPFEVGQPLLRIPRNAASFDVTWNHGRLMLNANAYFRGQIEDLEPNDGVFACQLGLPCLFTAKGYQLVNTGFSLQVSRQVQIYGTINNVLNQYYEEALGYPALRLNFLSGIRLGF